MSFVSQLTIVWTDDTEPLECEATLGDLAACELEGITQEQRNAHFAFICWHICRRLGVRDAGKMTYLEFGALVRQVKVGRHDEEADDPTDPT